MLNMLSFSIGTKKGERGKEVCREKLDLSEGREEYGRTGSGDSLFYAQDS